MSLQDIDVQSILAAFPKQRPELAPEFSRIYAEHYKNNRSSKGIIGSMAHKLEGWMHQRVVEDLRTLPGIYSTLEVGAGTLNHLDYDNVSRIYDVVEPYQDLYAGSAQKDRVRHFFSDISQVSASYDRIISIAAFEHLTHLPLVIARCGLLLNPGGSLRVAIPAEGNLAWKLAYTCTTGLAFAWKYRLSYEKLMRYEHVNTWQEIKALLEYFFARVCGRYFGLGPRLALYHMYNCQGPNIARCTHYADVQQESGFGDGEKTGFLDL